MILRDSVNAATIPLDGLAAVAGYGDGEFQWSSADWARFPASVVPLSIVVNPAHAGDILDVETADALPSDVPGWVHRFDRPGRRRPTIYSARGTWVDVVVMLRSVGLGASAVDWWAATLDGTQNVPGAVAVQYRDFGPYDESIILDPTWVGMSGGDDVDPTLASKLDQLANVLLGGGDNRVPNPAIFATLAAIRGDDAGVLAALQAGQQVITATKAELNALKAEVEAGGSVDAAAALARIEKALQGA